jgi:hypothetical protein
MNDLQESTMLRLVALLTCVSYSIGIVSEMSLYFAHYAVHSVSIIAFICTINMILIIVIAIREKRYCIGYFLLNLPGIASLFLVRVIPLG